MRKELGDDQVRITVRMSREMYQALRTVARERWGWGSDPRRAPPLCGLP
jgi:hypothetical protein